MSVVELPRVDNQPQQALYYYAAVRTLVGMLLLFAAGMKGYELATSPVASTTLLTTRWFLVAAVEGELALGLCLLLSILPRITWWISLLCFAGFASITAHGAWIGEVDCGCFGRAHVNPRITLAVDLVIILLLVLTRPSKRAGHFSRQIVAWTCLLIIGIPGGWLMASAKPAAITDEGIIAAGTFTVLEPEKWVNKAFPLFSHIDIGERLKTGKWFVVLYSDTCSHCMEALPKYIQIAQDLKRFCHEPQIALIQIPPFDEQLDLSTPIPAPVLKGQLDGKHAWFAETPVELQIEDGVVIRAVSKGKGLSWVMPQGLRRPSLHLGQRPLGLRLALTQDHKIIRVAHHLEPMSGHFVVQRVQIHVTQQWAVVDGWSMVLSVTYPRSCVPWLHAC